MGAVTETEDDVGYGSYSVEFNDVMRLLDKELTFGPEHDMVII